MQHARWNNGSESAGGPNRASGDKPTGSARRWDIWARQAAAGKRPCFASELRFTCTETDCPWREECRGLRAEWHR